MSIDIDWRNLTTGPSGQELADSIRDFIHDKFQQVQLPRFIRSVNVHSFNFGEECPVVEIKDISDPLDEFYEDDESSDEADELPLSPPTSDTPLPTPSLSHPAQPTQPSTASRPSLIDTRLPSLHPGISTPFLSRSTTPNIPGVTSNLSYFHLPLSAGLSGTQTPLAQWQQHDHQTQPQSNHTSSLHQIQQHNTTQQQQQQQQKHHHHHHPTYADPTSRPSTSHTLPPSLSPPFTATTSPPFPPTSTPLGGDDKTQDLQTTLHISYTGSLSLSLTAEILLDYPMPSFVGIPLKLQITGLSFDGVALLAYLRQVETGKRRVCFCFLGGGEGGGGGEGEGNGDGRIGGGLLREIRVESEIGRQEDGKVVLKNVGKVEKFVLEQVRRIFEEEFVWPSFWTFLI